MSKTKAPASAPEIVQSYGAAWGRGDFAAARKLLHDDLSFQGPLDTFHRADDYLAAIQKLGAIVKGMRHQKTIVEGNDAAVFYTLDTVLGASAVAEWYTVRGDRIASIRTYFDARPFAAAAGGKPGA